MGKELFTNIPSKIGDLLADVRNGKIGLPDLQRPFVWKDNKARDLLDSMMKGYPIGYVMLWQSPEDYESAGHIGGNDKIFHAPEALVIDGQQRLTVLLAAICGIKVRDKDYRERTIRIAFQPLTREFAVWTPAYDRNPEWVSAISEVFQADEEHAVSKFRKQFIKITTSANSPVWFGYLSALNVLDFENLPYPEFLEWRRKLMAGIVKKAYRKLCE